MQPHKCWRLPLTRKLLAIIFVASILVYVLLFITSLKRRRPEITQKLRIPKKKLKCSEKWDNAVSRMRDGTFTIRVPMEIDENLPKRRRVSSVRESLVKLGGRNVTVTYADLSRIDDNYWITPISKEVYDMYPQDLRMNYVMKNLLSCRAIPEKPMNEPIFRFHHVSSTVCAPDANINFKINNHDLVIIMKVALNKVQRRNRFRKFINKNRSLFNFSVGLVFSVGLPATSDINCILRDGFNISLGGTAGERLKNASRLYTTMKNKLDEEIVMHHDIILGDYVDTYFNLTIKMFHTIQWAAHFCRHEKPVFLLLDDEYQFNFTYMQNMFMSKTREEMNNLASGTVACSMPVYRHTSTNSFYLKWELSKKEMPWPIYPCYSLGYATLLGFESVRNLSLGMLFTKKIHIDDAYLGIVMHKSGIHLQEEPDMVQYLSLRKKTNKFIFRFEK